MAFALRACGVGGAAELLFERGDGGARGQHSRGVWRRARRGILDVASGCAGTLYSADAGAHYVLDAAGTD